MLARNEGIVMSLLKDCSKNNLLVSLRGITFSNPYFRRAFGQFPDTIDVVDLPKKNLAKRLKKMIWEKGEPFIVQVRNDEQCIEDIFLVPFEKKDGKINISSPFRIERRLL